jgi:hypothetical protein
VNDPDERPRDDAGLDLPDDHEPAFDDPTHAWVRDMLADARVTTPPPADVVARLDDTLAELSAERARSGLPAEEAADEPAATVVPLRRRFRPRLAAVAAAVIVVAAGGVALTRLDLGSSPSSDSAASGAADSATVTTTSPSVPGSAKGLATGAAPEALADSALPSLTTASFAADAAAVMRRVAVDQAQVAGSAGSASSKTPVPAQTPGEDPLDPPLTAATSSSKAVQAPPVTATPESLRTEDRAPGAVACAGPAVAGAVTLPATLDGTQVALVFRPPTAAGQRVEAWSCDGSTVLAAATVAP